MLLFRNELTSFTISLLEDLRKTSLNYDRFLNYTIDKGMITYSVTFDEKPDAYIKINYHVTTVNDQLSINGIDLHSDIYLFNDDKIDTPSIKKELIKIEKLYFN